MNWSDRLSASQRTNNIHVSVDGTDCPVSENHPFTPALFSHKLNRAGLRYEVAVSIFTGNIVWVNGPYRAGKFNDLQIFKHELKNLLNENELVIADSMYKDSTCIRPEQCFPENMNLHRRVRAHHEYVNGLLKRFKVLSSTFRHRHNLHVYCFHSIAHIVKLQLDYKNSE